MSASKNRSALLRFYNPGVSQADFGVLAELVHPDVKIHSALPIEAPGSKGIEPAIRILQGAFRDMKYTPHEVVADDDTAVVRVTITGVHSGEIFGVPATGIAFSFDEITIAHFENGRITELRALTDMMSLLQQLGAIPPQHSQPAAATPSDPDPRPRTHFGS